MKNTQTAGAVLFWEVEVYGYEIRRKQMASKMGKE